MEKEFLTLEEAAGLLDVPPRALRAATARGEVPGRCIAGRWRYSRWALHAWMGHETLRQDPWAEFAGALADSSLFDEVMANIATAWEHQREAEAEDHHSRIAA